MIFDSLELLLLLASWSFYADLRSWMTETERLDRSRERADGTRFKVAVFGVGDFLELF